MSSIFDLKTSVDELASTNQGTSRMEYQQVTPTRDVTGDNFANGAINFRWETSGVRWFIPGRSYIRTRFNITKGDATTPVALSDGIAPNMNLMSNLFQSAEFRINDKVVSRVADFLPQVDALETRLSKSKSWMDSVGNSTNWLQKDQSVRMAEISSDGDLEKGDKANSAAVLQANIKRLTGENQVAVYNATTEVAYNGVTGVITFSVVPGDNTDLVWKVGDIITLTGGAGLTAAGLLNVPMEVTAIVAAGVTLTVKATGANTQAAGVITFTQTRPVSKSSRRVHTFETIWQPPLSMFKIQHGLPGGSRYELVLNPQTSTVFQQRSIESALGVATKIPRLPGSVLAGQDYKVNVVDMFLYGSMVDGPRTENLTFLLDLEQTRCQSDKINNESFASKTFDVSPSTYALTACYQDLRAGTHTSISPSKFKSYDNTVNPVSSQELKLNRFFLQYAGQQLPALDADPNFIPQTGAVAAEGVDYTQQRFAETQMYSGAYHDSGGSETIEEFHDRGAYYYFSYPRDGTDRSTRCMVNSQFQTGTATANLRVLLFDHSRQVCRIKIESGRVTQIDLEDS